MNRRFCIVLLSVWFAITAANRAPAGSARIPEPHPSKAEVTEGRFGDDEVVSLLAPLLDDPDTVTRTWAVEHLGQTHNPAAIPHIRRALADEEGLVRAGAALAAAKVGFPEAHDIILKALGSDHPEVLFAAMGALQDLNLTGATQDLTKLLASDDTIVRATALKTLTHLRVAPSQGNLAKLIADESTGVRLAALASVMLLDRGDKIVNELLAAAGDDNPPAVRSRAFEALGKFAFSRGQQLIFAGGRDGNPLVRRGAARGYHYAGKGPQAAAFLTDPSHMVRLAAIKAAGDMKIAEKTSRLFKLLFDAKDDMTRRAAREALAKIGTEEVVQTAAESLLKWGRMLPSQPRPTTEATTEAAASRKPPAPTRTRPGLERSLANAASCCWLLGKLKSKSALDYQLSMLTKADVVSPVLLALVPALAEIGDTRAVDPLVMLLGRCRARGKKWLADFMAGRQPPPWEPEIPCSIMRALVDLGAYEAAGEIVSIATITNWRGGRLSYCAAGAAQALPNMANDRNRAKIAEFLLLAIAGDRGYSFTARYHAAKAAARLGLESAVPPLEDILTKERPGWDMMKVSAWAIQEITGQTPQLPQPRLRQGQDWVIRKIVD